jgi:hypothetical protein
LVLALDLPIDNSIGDLNSLPVVEGLILADTSLDVAIIVKASEHSHRLSSLSHHHDVQIPEAERGQRTS